MNQEIPHSRTGLHDSIGDSLLWHQTMAMVGKIAPLEIAVLVTGNSGAGKEVVAQALHRLSQRVSGAFVPLNCSLLQDNLLESELFGHVKGAFTGAAANKEGLCQVAAGGTLFLDEIGELPASSQAMLLRLLETGEYRPLGGTTIKRSNARIVAATNRDLPRMIAEGTFRQDLYYRLNVLSIDVPPLQHRKDDIPLLVEYFLQHGNGADAVCKLTPAAMERLQAHHWPGNVRELKNVVERLRLFCDDTEIGEEMVQCMISGSASVTTREHTTLATNSACHTKPAFASVEPLVQMERAYVQWALDQHQGNVTDAARTLGIARSTIYRILRRDGSC